jgi:hypothetical protein
MVYAVSAGEDWLNNGLLLESTRILKTKINEPKLKSK